MPTYKTPGVYIEEISVLPPSIEQVATAIPVFIGYTEKAGYCSGYLLDRRRKYADFLDIYPGGFVGWHYPVP